MIILQIIIQRCQKKKYLYKFLQIFLKHFETAKTVTRYIVPDIDPYMTKNRERKKKSDLQGN